MTDTLAPLRTKIGADSKYFYFHMAIACAVIAFVGFVPTYWQPLAAGALKTNPVIHIHGMLYFAWTLFYVFQTWLAASGQVARHRSVGLIGVSFATAMTIFGVLVTIQLMRDFTAVGRAGAGEAFAIVAIVGIVFFAACILLALVNLRRPETHKRLMLLATVSILAAPVARWFFILVPALGHPPSVPSAVGPACVTFLLIVIAMIHDWRTRGRPHPVYVIGGTVFIILNFLQIPVSQTQSWHAIAGWISGLAG